MIAAKPDGKFTGAEMVVNLEVAVDGLITELESKNKENTELKESLEKHSIFKAVSKIKKAEGDLEAHRKAFLKDSENSNKIIYNQQSDIESKNKENTDLRDLNTQLSREYDQMVVDWNAAREVVKEQQKEIERYKADIKLIADNLLCAGEVIKRANPELGKAYKTFANKHLKEKSNGD